MPIKYNISSLNNFRFNPNANLQQNSNLSRKCDFIFVNLIRTRDLALKLGHLVTHSKACPADQQFSPRSQLLEVTIALAWKPNKQAVRFANR
jgi:hypothetical protein